MKKWVFISHPLSGDVKNNREKVDKVCKNILEEYDKQVIPISPLHLFKFIDNEEGLRDSIMQVCFFLIEGCDEVWIYGDSEGCKLEKEYAINSNTPIVYKGGKKWDYQ